MTLKRDIRGFSLIELIITMAVTVVVLAMASQILVALITQFKQQGKVAETGIESVVGLEIMRRDLQSSGYGLAGAVFNGTDFDSTDWSILTGYTEATIASANSFNDAPNSPPRALIANNPAFTTLNDSDYLVIKSVTAARNDTSGKSHLLDSDNNANSWSHPTAAIANTENLTATDKVIVVSARDEDFITLIQSGGIYNTTFNNTSAYAPSDSWETRIIYGIDPSAMSFPFNRVDYYIMNSLDGVTVPSRCAGGTGILMKRVLKHSDGTFGSANEAMPILDCVADMQVILGLDMNGNGVAETMASAGGTAISSSEGATVGTVQAALNSPAEIRDKLKLIKVFVLAHEGQRDPKYQYSKASVVVGESGLGRVFDFAAIGIPSFADYRWKIYTLSEKPKALR
jgi:prepilin-type N-terminal cleavage/methylation domain-containing protein